MNRHAIFKHRNFQQIMTPEQIHDIAVFEFRLEPRSRADGQSYWTPETAESKAARILRVSQDANGAVREVKLAVSSLVAAQDVFISTPLTEERVRDAIVAELRGGCGQSRNAPDSLSDCPD
jgi:hypothetical protein